MKIDKITVNKPFNLYLITDLPQFIRFYHKLEIKSTLKSKN